MNNIDEYASVYLDKLTEYRTRDIAAWFDTTFRKDGGDRSWHGKKVLLKPNLISARVARLSCTDPRFLLALAQWFVEQGARVSVGDSPAYGSARVGLKALGIEGELVKRGVQIVEFVKGTEVLLPCGVSVNLASEVLESDLVVNVPRIKAHNQMYVTLAVKNIFGIVRSLRKSMLHMVHGGKDGRFTQIIVDLFSLLPENISVLDGIIGMHVQGPIRGEAIDIGCVAYARDPFAMDTAILSLLQLEPAMSPLWREGVSRGYQGCRIEKLHFPHLHPEAFGPIRFQTPDTLSPIRFNPFRFIYGNVKRLAMNLVKN